MKWNSLKNVAKKRILLKMLLEKRNSLKMLQKKWNSLKMLLKKLIFFKNVAKDTKFKKKNWYKNEIFEKFIKEIPFLKNFL